MEQQTLYRNVTLSVRTHRFAILIDKNSPYWHTYIEGIIQAFTQTWGGEYFIIIPTDGRTIEEKFWEILELYSPDILGRYAPSLLDLQEADPDLYHKTKEHYKNKWALESNEKFEENWNAEVSRSTIRSIEISKELVEELKDRLSPFHSEYAIISQNIRRGEPLGYPFTRILDIVEYANNKPEKVTVPKTLTAKELRLLASSRTGAVTESFIDELNKKGINSISCPPDLEDKDYVLSLEMGQEDINTQRRFRMAYKQGDGAYPDMDFLQHLPFKLSMVGLAIYYRLDTHREYEENLVVVVGDTITDYCLYYCLSRMHEGVYWLPDNLLSDANEKVNTIKRHAAGEETEKLTDAEELTTSLVATYIRRIGYGNTQKRIRITSASLSDEQLELRQAWMDNIVWPPNDKVSATVAVRPLRELNIHCVGRVIEMNNYFNQQDMIFQDGTSVGKLNTPKPKNFSYINPMTHRWITSVEIDGYRPPVLPFLSKDIIELRQSSYETRVAADGLAYLCPNIGYFGGDVDTNTVRPTLRLMDEAEIFAKYFGHSGYNIELSDKGSYLKDTIERFGSLQAAAAFFRVKQQRDIFDQFLSSTTVADQGVIYLNTEKRAYLSFDAFERILEDADKATALLDELTAKDIVRRGFIFQRSRCRLASWYDLGEVSREFTCKRCGLIQLFSQRHWKKPKEPMWYYNLAQTVYLFYKSSSHLTALTLDKLRQQSKEAFHYLCETDVKRFSEQGRPIEIDILAISDGKLILGECKDCEPKAVDLRKYQSLQSQLKLKPDRFVLSTTEMAISDQVRNEMSKLKNGDVLLRSELIED